MFARSLALLAAASLAIAPVPAFAQQEDKTPTSNIPTTEEQQGSDLLLILGAIVAAGLLAFLASNIGGHDTPASP